MRHRERRAVYQALKDGTLQRRAPTALEVKTLMNAIDRKDINVFGVRTLSVFDLNVLYPMPAGHTLPASHNVAFESRVTIIAYAAWRRRHDIVKHLLIAGASPTVCDLAPAGALENPDDEAALEAILTRRNGTGLASAAAVYAVECVTKLRCFAARDRALGAPALPCTKCGSRGRTLCFDPCGCLCCDGCVWREFIQPTASANAADRDRGELTCPCCT